MNTSTHYGQNLPKYLPVYMHEFIFMQRCDIDVDAAISAIGQSEPFLVITGRPGDEGSRVFISCEGEIFVSSKSVIDGMLDLMAIYFSFDITYPKSTSSVLLFIQHFVFDLKDEQLLPPATVKLVSNLEKIGQ